MDTSSATSPLPTPQELDAWLAAHAPEQTVGSRLSIRACPLSCYLSKRTGQAWLVWGDTAEPADERQASHRLSLDPWLACFTANVDSHPEQTLNARAARAYLYDALCMTGHTMGDTP